MSETKVTQLAKNKWKNVLVQLGVNERILDGRHHPCPRSGEGNDRFRFSNKDGKGNFFCACNDGKSDGFKLLECMFGWDFKEAAVRVEEIVGETNDDPEERRSKEHALRDLRGIQNCVRQQGPSDERTRAYLANRGIDLAKVYRPGVLHDASTSYGLKAIGITDNRMAMVAKVVTSKGLPSTFHLTYLDGDKKASHERSRVVATPVAPMAGGCVRLAPWAEGPLGVAEGIETAYSAMELFNMPVWATLNAGQMEKFEPPEGCKEIVVYGDNDASYTGQAAAFILAKRLRLKHGIPGVRVVFPKKINTDFNDVLQEVRGHG